MFKYFGKSKYLSKGSEWMQGLKIKQNLIDQQLTITDICTGKVMQNLYTTQLGQFYHWLKFYEEPLHYIEVPFNESYIEIIYVLRPQTLVVIDKETVYQFFADLFGFDVQSCMEEVAATFERGTVGLGYDFGEFLARFYESQTRQQAVELYNRWQELIPLNNEGLCKALEIIEYYLDEILNYFSLINAQKSEKVMR